MPQRKEQQRDEGVIQKGSESVGDLMPDAMREFHNQPRGQPSDELAEQYNILVLGETQSGKSTLIQYMRMYADPEVVIDTTVLGTGTLSHTMDIQPTSITTGLPEFYITDKNRDIVDYGIADGDNM
ncbi:hypothetical protein BGZ59_003981, partial [Podila verticillata]